jgi:hypothetical protein
MRTGLEGPDAVDEVAGAEAVELAEHLERVADGMPAFDTDQAGDFAGPADADNVVSGVGHLEIVGILFDEAVNNVYLLVG